MRTWTRRSRAITSSQKDLSDWSRDSKKFKIDPTSVDTCAVCSYAEKKKKKKKKEKSLL